MINVERATRIEAPADLAWKVLGDFAIPELIEGICTRVTVEGSGPGAVRTMHLAEKFGRGYVKERLESLNEADRHMTYRMVDCGPVPFGDYMGSVRVTPAGDEACVIVITAAFVPVDLDDATARAISVGNITQALENARRAVMRRKVSGVRAD